MANSMFGGNGGSSMLDQAVGAMKSFGATDAMMNQLYNSNPQVRQIVDQYKGQSIHDLLRQHGVDPSDVLRRFGINR